jgi:hypothetical protein
MTKAIGNFMEEKLKVGKMNLDLLGFILFSLKRFAA